jgi:hypothetical protein
MPPSPLAIPTVDDLLAQATARTGLDNFGLPSFREGLERYLESVREEERYFTPAGVTFLMSQFVNRLSQRLGVEDWYASHPDVEQQRPENPLMITGLPRTGTSALSSILSLEPAFRCLRHWEMEPPVPPPVLGAEDNDPRRLSMQRRFDEMRVHRPDLIAMHLWEMESTTEDGFLLALAFQDQGFQAPVFRYQAWWRDSDMSQAYLYQRRVVKLLQSRRPPYRWLFKAPHYVFHMEAVCAAYPDARFVVTHRDPVKVLPSWTSLLTALLPPGTRELFPPEVFGRYVATHQEIGMRRLLASRERLGEGRFLDVHHAEFVRNPIDQVGRIYDFLGLRFAAETEAAMKRWLSTNTPGAHGKHTYSLDHFGLDENLVRQQFRFYTEAFDVRSEPQN